MTTDQRYVVRPQLAGGACDIGAYEFTEYLKAGLAIDASVTVNPKNGIAVVSGTTTCGTQLPVELEIRLATPEGRARLGDDPGRRCRDRLLRRHDVLERGTAPASGGFQTGAATATVMTTNSDKWFEPATATKAVKLFWGRK